MCVWLYAWLHWNSDAQLRQVFCWELNWTLLLFNNILMAQAVYFLLLIVILKVASSKKICLIKQRYCMQLFLAHLLDLCKTDVCSTNNQSFNYFLHFRVLYPLRLAIRIILNRLYQLLCSWSGSSDRVA